MADRYDLSDFEACRSKQSAASAKLMQNVVLKIRATIATNTCFKECTDMAPRRDGPRRDLPPRDGPLRHSQDARLRTGWNPVGWPVPTGAVGHGRNTAPPRGVARRGRTPADRDWIPMASTSKRPAPAWTANNDAFKACLNKLNNTNLSKIQKLVSERFFSDAGSSMATLLERCVSQVEFLPVFMMLYDSLMASAESESDRSIMRGNVDAFVESFVRTKPFLEIGKLEEEYDEFCAWVARRKRILSQHKTVIDMLDNARTDQLDLHTYFGVVLGSLYDYVDDMGSASVPQVPELIMDMLADFFGSVKQQTSFRGEWTTAVRDALHDKQLSAHFTAKCRFKLLDLVEKRPKARRL